MITKSEVKLIIFFSILRGGLTGPSGVLVSRGPKFVKLPNFMTVCR